MNFQALASDTVIGLTLGGIFALAALGIVLVFRVTGVLNFANGAIGMFATFIAGQILYQWKMGVFLAVLGGLVFAIVLGVVLELLVFRWLVGRPQLVKAVITIGVLLVLQAGASLIWGNTQYHFPIPLPGSNIVFKVFNVPVSFAHMEVIITALALAGGLAAFLRYTRMGVAMRAVSEDPDVARLWGVPVQTVGILSWVLGCVVAAIAGILITPFVALDTVSLTVLVLDALAAALIGGLVSLPLTVAGGFMLGLLEVYSHDLLGIQSVGFQKVIAIAVILGVLLLRKQSALVGRQA